MRKDTIVAISTPPGRGGVGIIRLSGSLALDIAQLVTKNKNITPRSALYRTFYDLEDGVVDEGIVLFFNMPNSFTGEDVVEFQVHGSPFVLDALVNICITKGARQALPGEFSERAFLNNKIDLTQAEAIADLIHASSNTAARMATRSLQGDFSKQINALNNELIYLRLYVEAALDFPEEDIDFLNDGKVEQLLKKACDNLAVIRASAHQGSLMREGLSLVIAGLPNAGKSTLMNALSGRDVAIVTSIAGTTRDVMHEHILLDDIPLHLIDTAGLRESDDVIEQEGIKRAWNEVVQADCILLVIDACSEVDSVALNDSITVKLTPGVPIIRVINKIDLLNKSINVDENAIYLSARSGEGVPLLKARIKEIVGYQPTEGTFIARRRHLQALDVVDALLTDGHQQLLAHHAGELLAEDLRRAHISLCEITGEFTSDDLLGEIFSSFCIGK